MTCSLKTVETGKRQPHQPVHLSFIFFIAIILLTAGQVVIGGSHPNCKNPEVGQNTDKTCGWKFYKPTRAIDLNIHPEGKCVACYSNACSDTQSEHCKRECPKYWQLCVNYTEPKPLPEVELDVKATETQTNAAAHIVGPVVAVVIAMVVIVIAIVLVKRSRKHEHTTLPVHPVTDDEGELMVSAMG